MIIKNSVPDHAQDFSFTGTCFAAFSLDDDADGTLPNTKSGPVPAGTCTVIEGLPPAPWILQNIVCVDPTTNSTTSVPTRTATINVAAGETVVCTFTNTTSAQFLVAKDFQPNNPANVTVGLNCSSGSVANDDPTASESDSANFTVTGFTPPATCTATENPVPTGYTPNQTDCQSVDLVGDGQCTIINVAIAPTLTVVKQVINDNGGTAIVSDFILRVDGTQVTSGVANSYSVGTHVVSEDDPGAGYSSNIGGACAANGTVTLNPGDVKTCTIVNDDAGTPPPGPNPVGGKLGLLSPTETNGEGASSAESAGGVDATSVALMAAVAASAIAVTACSWRLVSRRLR
jgi:hypothetical protein